MRLNPLDWFSRRRTRLTTKDLDFLHSQDRFRDILEVERMRADRTASKFCLVVFDVPVVPNGTDETDSATDDLHAPEGPVVAFARHLEERRRATDHVGIVDGHRLGVVLWDTAEDGAWTFAETVTAKWTGSSPPTFQVYLYPSYTPPPKPSSHEDVDSQDDDSNHGSPAESVPDEIELVPTGHHAETRPLEPLFVRRLPLGKRLIDVVGASVGLVVLSPLLLLVAALIKLTSKGPVFFTQQRTGHGGREFKIYKFRTMCVDAEARKAALRRHSEQDGPAFKLAHDPRITPIGHVLRKSCVDELPQLWNVLVGDMTLVGPRPLDVKEAQYTSGWERRRLDVTPGLTCIWQVDGKSRVTFAEWMRMDIRYARLRSYWADAKLVFRTIVAVLRLKASQ